MEDESYGRCEDVQRLGVLALPYQRETINSFTQTKRFGFTPAPPKSF